MHTCATLGLSLDAYLRAGLLGGLDCPGRSTFGGQPTATASTSSCYPLAGIFLFRAPGGDVWGGCLRRGPHTFHPGDGGWSSNYPPSVSPVRLPHTLRLRQIVVLHAQQGGSAICLTTLPSVPPVRLPLMGNTGVATHLSCTCVLDANPNASPCNVITTITIVAICRRVVTLVVG